MAFNQAQAMASVKYRSFSWRRTQVVACYGDSHKRTCQQTAGNKFCRRFERFIERQRQRRRVLRQGKGDSYDSPAIAVVSILLRFMLWKGEVA
jgi:hypothetical protein